MLHTEATLKSQEVALLQEQNGVKELENNRADFIYHENESKTQNNLMIEMLKEFKCRKEISATDKCITERNDLEAKTRILSDGLTNLKLP